MRQNIYTFNEIDGTMVVTFQDKETGEITKTLKYKDRVAKVVYEKALTQEETQEILNKLSQQYDNINEDLDRLIKTQRTNKIDVYVNKAIDTLFDVLVKNNMVDLEKYKKDDFAKHFMDKLTNEQAIEAGGMTVGQIFNNWKRGQHFIVDNSLAVWEWHNKTINKI